VRVARPPQAWTASLETLRAALDADTSLDRTRLLRATTQELGATRDAVIDAVVARLELPHPTADEAYTLAEQTEPNPRSVWGYVQGLTRLSQRTPWPFGELRASPERRPLVEADVEARPSAGSGRGERRRTAEGGRPSHGGSSGLAGPPLRPRPRRQPPPHHGPLTLVRVPGTSPHAPA
jgi:hypothetical protein